MKFKLDDLKKVESTTVPPKALDPEQIVSAIVKVKKEGYTPKNVKVRARISPELVTCDIAAKHLAALEKDDNVLSVSVSKELHAE